jgi:DNA repair protein RadC
MSIQQWPSQLRPREKLLAQGAIALSDAELLAIFLRTGNREKNAVALSQDLLAHFGSLRALLHCSQKEFECFKGLGSVKFAQLQAVTEMSRRYLQEKITANVELNQHHETLDFLTAKLRHLTQEVFVCLFLSTQNKLIAYEELSKGTFNKSPVFPREIVKRALHHNASSVILAHNHPSGSCKASTEDISITQHIKEALALIDVSVLDHIIIGEGKAVSLAAEGWV